MARHYHPSRMKRKALIDFIATREHYNIMDEGETETNFKLGLFGYKMPRLRKIARDGF